MGEHFNELQYYGERWIARNWIGLSSGFVFTGLAMIAATNERGYFAIGGEFFILPVCFIASRIAQNYMRRKRHDRRMQRQSRRKRALA